MILKAAGAFRLGDGFAAVDFEGLGDGPGEVGTTFAEGLSEIFSLASALGVFNFVDVASGSAGSIALPIAPTTTNRRKIAAAMAQPLRHHGRWPVDARTAAIGAGAAGDGFVLTTESGMQFVNTAGRVARVTYHQRARRPVATRDSFVPYLQAVFRPSKLEAFDGTASPNGSVSAVDVNGRMWAVGHDPSGRTVVRSAVPGRPWRTQVLGPGIGADYIQGAGSTLMVAGRNTSYVSDDAGETWTLVPGPYPGGERAATFRFWPDGTIITGDYGAPYRLSHDGGKSFEDPSSAEDVTPRLLGDLFARGAPGATEVSQDRIHWHRFTPAVVRQLVRHDAP